MIKKDGGKPSRCAHMVKSSCHLRGSFKLSRLYLGFHPSLFLVAFLLPLFDPLLNTHMLSLTCLPLSPPSFPLCKPEREETRQINVEISTKPRQGTARGVGGGFPHPSIHLPHAPSIRPSLFHGVKRADTGPFCLALIGHLVMLHR